MSPTTAIGWTLGHPKGYRSIQILVEDFILAGADPINGDPIRWSVSHWSSSEAAREAIVNGCMMLERKGGMVLQDGPRTYRFNAMPNLAAFDGHSGESEVLTEIYETLLAAGVELERSAV